MSYLGGQLVVQIEVTYNNGFTLCREVNKYRCYEFYIIIFSYR
jgi:hypothetical protein